jgi:modulator of FtsH protease HflK
MPWQSQGGGGPWGGGPWSGGPWGGGPRGTGGPGQIPSLEDLLRKSQERVRRAMPGGVGGGGLAIVIGIGLVLWGISGFYRVEYDEQGVEMRFGRYTTTTQPGLHYHLPYPIETVETPRVTRQNRLEVGFRTFSDTGRIEPTRPDHGRQIPEEALMLTGDENIVDINFVVTWRIADARNYLFNVRSPEATIKAVAESTMREIIGQTPIAAALAERRGEIEVAAQRRLQETLDSYSAGIEVQGVQLLKVDPPAEVIDAFRDVQRARANQEQLRNEAEAYRNAIIPEARGQAERLTQEAEAYRQEVVARSQGDAERFINVYEAFRNARDVTTKRLYLETLEEVLRDANKVIIDKNAGGSGVVPYLPLNEIGRTSPPAPAPAQSVPAAGVQRR